MIADSTTCLICSSKMSYYFSKNFEESHLGNVDYWRCESCGFVSSKTHFDMTDAEWQDLNDTWHAQSHSNSSNPYNRNQRYFNQALMLSLMKSHDLISDEGWLDWGAGVGAVSELLEKYFGGKLFTYDKYLKCPINPIDEAKLRPKTFDLVSSMAFFEPDPQFRLLVVYRTSVTP